MKFSIKQSVVRGGDEKVLFFNIAIDGDKGGGEGGTWGDVQRVLRLYVCE